MVVNPYVAINPYNPSFMPGIDKFLQRLGTLGNLGMGVWGAMQKQQQEDTARMYAQMQALQMAFQYGMDPQTMTAVLQASQQGHLTPEMIQALSHNMATVMNGKALQQEAGQQQVSSQPNPLMNADINKSVQQFAPAHQQGMTNPFAPQTMSGNPFGGGGFNG